MDRNRGRGKGRPRQTQSAVGAQTGEGTALLGSAAGRPSSSARRSFRKRRLACESCRCCSSATEKQKHTAQRTFSQVFLPLQKEQVSIKIVRGVLNTNSAAAPSASGVANHVLPRYTTRLRRTIHWGGQACGWMGKPIRPPPPCTWFSNAQNSKRSSRQTNETGVNFTHTDKTTNTGPFSPSVTTSVERCNTFKQASNYLYVAVSSTK